MRRCTNRSFWRDRLTLRKYRTAVSLHSHTFYSREILAVILRSLRRLTLTNWTLPRRRATEFDVDISRLWWTPPLGPRQAWTLERAQIQSMLDAKALVSITDHDNIDAPLALRVLDESRHIPVSVEWTVPYRATFFHLGVHNMKAARAREFMAEMQVYTANPGIGRLRELLVELNRDPAVLVVFNHPLWDEKGIGKHAHRQAAESFLCDCRGLLHALELNGFRSGRENRLVEDLSIAVNLPTISGGDRHGREPNSNVNLTSARTFSEFVAEVRQDGISDILSMPQQSEALPLRFLRAVCDVVRDDPYHGLGWVRWSDRVFYRGGDGKERPLSEHWGDGHVPRLLERVVASAQCLDTILSRRNLRVVSGRARGEEAGL